MPKKRPVPRLRSLAKYRAKRNFKVTKEPPPEAEARPAKPGERPSFMVHKHDASRLHYDLRLEIDGVLASWSIPKGPSFDPSEKRLAVQTEDHPLAYGGFEGRIADGEYGAGDSLIWDRGTYDTDPPGQAAEARRLGKMTVYFDGQKLKGKFHLVRTKQGSGELPGGARTRGQGSGELPGGARTRGQGPGEARSWLFFKGTDEHVRKDWDVTVERPESVVSGRRITRGPVRKKDWARAARVDPLDLLLKVWPPMLATLTAPDFAFRDEEWVYEVKYDGFRALAGIAAGKVSLQSRNGLDLSERFPRIHRALKKLRVPDCVLDGEIVALDRKGASKFQELQQSGTRQRYIAFDLLWLQGEDVRNRPLEERRELLESVLSNVETPIVLSERISGRFQDALDEARARGEEGLLAKRRGSTYRGERGREWRKVKVHATQELAIVGYTPISSGERMIGALLLGVMDKGMLRYAGKVGTGFSDKVRRELLEMLEGERSATPIAAHAPRMRDAVWVMPKHVAQLEFTEWTAEGRVRHPAFQGLRPDKKPEECVVEPFGKPSGESAETR